MPAADQPCPPVGRVAADGNLKLTVTVDKTSAWRQQGGNLEFRISGPDASLDGLSVQTCYRWSVTPAAGAWVPGAPVRLVDAKRDASSLDLLSSVPDLGPEPHSWWQRVTFQAGDEAFTALGFVPVAEFRVLARSGDQKAWRQLDVTNRIGITNQLFAGFAALLVAVIAWTALAAFGRARSVPASGNPILQVITNRAGYASLNQLQIILWSFVVGASAIYVMALSGDLIELSSGMLVLLGISGVSTLGANLKASADAASRQPIPTPGKVIGPHANEPPSASEVRLTWAAPLEGAPDGYMVQHREADTPGATWTTAASGLLRCGFRVTGLRPSTRYVFNVVALNQSVRGLDSEVTVRTAAEPEGAFRHVTGLRPGDMVGNTTMSVTWDEVAEARGYALQVRRRHSDDGWRPVPPVGASALLRGLEPQTVYDIRVAALGPATAAGAAIHGNWRYMAVSTTGPRVPRWSDLVVEGDIIGEIDVTRVQMLFFTVVIAAFVVMRVLATNEIPVIPDSFQALMGISNGVYLGAKFVRR